MEYIRQIDGLRGLSVLAVVMFHSGLQMFSGGFVGVDIFFVISGFLITSIILSDLKFGKFSIIDFYERRARRILPALFFVILTCIPVSYFLLLPTDMKYFSQSLVAVSFFVSNIYFWRVTDYFDPASELNPLLHTWSLAVEEQYYILFPLLLILLWPFGKRCIILALSLIFIISLTTAEIFANSNPVAAFYLLPTRAWELLLGSLTAIFLSKVRRSNFGWVACELNALVGFLLILYAIFAYSKTTPFPGLYALVPTFGSVLIIVFATPNTIVGKFLVNRILVNVGLISYSLYLWHQPLFAFARYYTSKEPSYILISYLSAFAMFLAYLSYKFVELPFRGSKVSRKYIFILTIAISTLFISFGVIGIANKGFEFRFNDQEREILSYNNYEFKEIYRQSDCFLNTEQSHKEFKKFCYPENSNDTILVWGDSHAAAFSYGLRSNFLNIAQYTASGCPPILGVAINQRPMCKTINNFIFDEILIRKPKTIILHANWILYDDQHFLDNLVSTLNHIKDGLPNSKIIMIGGVPQFDPSLPKYLVNHRIKFIDNAKVSPQAYNKILSLDSHIRLVASPLGVLFFSSLDSLCDDDGCLVVKKYNDKLMLMTWDYGHLTIVGSLHLASKFKSFYLQK